MSMTWHGVNSETVYCYVEKYPDIMMPKRKRQKFSVPGRNGDIIIDEDAFENVQQKYEIYISAKRSGLSLAETVRRVVAWLLVPGYQTLVDSYNSGITRYAALVGGYEIRDSLLRYGKATLYFDCKPQRYLNSYLNTGTTISSSPGTITNPTMQTARPKIKLSGSGNGGILKVGGTQVSISGAVNNVLIDSEELNCTRGSTEANSSMSGDFPTLAPGDNAIEFSGSITSITITPRYFEL